MRCLARRGQTIRCERWSATADRTSPARCCSTWAWNRCCTAGKDESNMNPNFETLSVALAGGVATVELNRPDKANAMNQAMWEDIRLAFLWVDETPEARVAIIGGRGKYFTSGLDLGMVAGFKKQNHDDCDGRYREKLRRQIIDLQDPPSPLDPSPKPVIAAIQGACI